jgi:hypothetical protein
MTRDELRRVLDTQIALNRGEHQIAKLANHADNDAQTNQADWVI